MTFAGSRLLAEQFSPVDLGIFRSQVEDCFAAANTPISADIVKTVMRPPLLGRLRGWQRTRERIKVLERPGRHAEALRQLILIQHCLNQINSAEGINPFDPQHTYPSGTELLSEVAAQAMLDYGREQFKELKESCQAITDWARTGNGNGGRLVFVESPLGNVIPVQLVNQMLHRAEIPSEVFQVSLPRNERRGLAGRITLGDRVRGFVDQLDSNQQLVYLDDAITGSRFKKTLAELRRATRARKLRDPIAIAYGCYRYGGLSAEQEKIRAGVRQDVEKVGQMAGLQGWVELPSLPSIDCSAEGRRAWESPLAWGESDLIVGLRKVNLVFNLIEEFQFLSEQFCQNDSTAIQRLELLWKTDRTGQEFVFDRGTLAIALCAASKKIDWSEVHAQASLEFASDYQGDLPDLTEDGENSFVERRMIWLRNQVVAQAGRDRDDQSEGWMLWNAIDNLFVTNDARSGDPRDRDFCYYFIEYHPAIARLRETIIEGLLGSALDT